METREEMVVRWLEKPREPLCERKWEDMHADAEMPSVFGLEFGFDELSEEEKNDEVKKMAKNILILSEEIFRLRLTYGERVWKSVFTTEEEDLKERKMYEDERGKYNTFSVST